MLIGLFKYHVNHFAYILKFNDGLHVKAYVEFLLHRINECDVHKGIPPLNIRGSGLVVHLKVLIIKDIGKHAVQTFINFLTCHLYPS